MQNEVLDVYQHLTMIQNQRYHAGCTDACNACNGCFGAWDERLLYQHPKTPISNKLSFSFGGQLYYVEQLC